MSQALIRSPLLALALALAGPLSTSCRHREELPPACGPALVTESQLSIAREELNKAAKATEPYEAAGHALLAAEIAWDLDWKTSGEILQHDTRRAARIYDAAVLRLMSLAREPLNATTFGNRVFKVAGPRGKYALTIDPRTFIAQADYPELKTAAAFHGKGGFGRRLTREGVGVPMVGINRDPSLFSILTLPGPDKMKRREGYTAPRTAVLMFDKPVPPGGTRNVKFAIVDPRKVEKETIGRRSLPIAADFTAPLMAAYPAFGSVWPAIVAALYPDSWLPSSGIYAFERYDPERIPVLLVHGLFSTPDMWKNVINELNATPGIGGKYQFYVFTYPTGISPAYTAAMLREKLRKIQQAQTLPQGYVLIGHSMGGILSRVQATDSGTAIWNETFGDKAAVALRQSHADDPIRRGLIFKADPKVRRIIYVCVPHRGSPLAEISIARFFGELAEAPFDITQAIAASPLRALGLLPAKLPSSAEGLSENSPVLKAMDKLPVRAPTHSIIGNRGKPGPLEQSSDGIVPYWSSHQDSALSEKIIPTGHGGFDDPQAIAEMERVLELDAAGLHGGARRHRLENP